MENRKRIIIIAIFLVLSLCVTVVATVAFFNYAKEGSTDNVIETGTIEFHYDEVSKKGNGIELIDALPVASNDTEKTNNTYFEFNITAKTMSLPISYVVTAKKSVDSDNMDDLVDLYLSDDNNNELFDGVHKYSDLIQYRNKPDTEKVIYTDTVPADQTNFRKDFRLRMWIDEGVDFSGTEVTTYYCSGVEVVKDSEAYNNCDVTNLTQTTEMKYEYNGKMFKITVNVYTENDISNYKVSTAMPLTNYVRALVTSSVDPSSTNTTLVLADDPDNNPRYVGSDPDNYVYFNCSTDDLDLMNDSTCEKWRIIGIFDNRIKLIRAAHIGNFSWDYTDKSVNKGYGVNEWSTSVLMQELNGDYLNTSLTEDPQWLTIFGPTYNGADGHFNHELVLKQSSQNLIDDAVWHTSTLNYADGTYYNLITSVADAYAHERGTVGKCNRNNVYCNDDVTRNSTWIGKVGLPYLSDYSYSTSGSTTTPRETCLSTYSWYSYPDCANNSWFIKAIFTIIPYYSPTTGSQIYAINYQGFNVVQDAYKNMGVLPTVYLKSNVKIYSGNGSSATPYKLGL